MSNLGKWDYSGLSEACYSGTDQITYKHAAKFLKDNVEDWGCGTAWAKRYFKKYRGIDGSPSGHEDEVVDLIDYTSNVENILLKDVIEYDVNWEKILINAKKSFSKKLCLIISTPFVNKTRVGVWGKPIKADGSHGEGKIPEMYFAKKDILAHFPQNEFKTSEEFVETEYLYGTSWILYVEKI